MSRETRVKSQNAGTAAGTYVEVRSRSGSRLFSGVRLSNLDFALALDSRLLTVDFSAPPPVSRETIAVPG